MISRRLVSSVPNPSKSNSFVTTSEVAVRFFSTSSAGFNREKNLRLASKECLFSCREWQWLSLHLFLDRARAKIKLCSPSLPMLVFAQAWVTRGKLSWTLKGTSKVWKRRFKLKFPKKAINLTPARSWSNPLFNAARLLPMHEYNPFLRFSGKLLTKSPIVSNQFPFMLHLTSDRLEL